MNKDQTIKSFLTFIEANGFQDDVRICLSNKKVKAPNRLILSLLQLLNEHSVSQEILYALKLKASHRQKLSFELHYTDGYRSWYYENRVNGADAFYWHGWLISLCGIDKACPYIEALNRAEMCLLDGKHAQLLPKSFYEKHIFPNCNIINAFLEDVRGEVFWGCEWCQEENETIVYANIEEQKIVSSYNGNCLGGRPAVKL